MKRKNSNNNHLHNLHHTLIHAQQTVENQFRRPLSDVLTEYRSSLVFTLHIISTQWTRYSLMRFQIRPYSVEESLSNILTPFDYKFEKQGDNRYKLKPYEYYRRTVQEGEKMLTYLWSLYPDKDKWEERKSCLLQEVREILGIDSLLAKRVSTKPLLSKARKFAGYTVRNFAIETLPGLYVAGSVYSPLSKGDHPLIICPNGHFGGGRYREDQQLRMATLARMGAVCGL